MWFNITVKNIHYSAMNHGFSDIVLFLSYNWYAGLVHENTELPGSPSSSLTNTTYHSPPLIFSHNHFLSLLLSLPLLSLLLYLSWSQGNLSLTSVVLEGQVERGRFGTSVVNLGDIDDDSYEGVCMCIEWYYVYTWYKYVYMMRMGRYLMVHSIFQISAPPPTVPFSVLCSQTLQ